MDIWIITSDIPTLINLDTPSSNVNNSPVVIDKCKYVTYVCRVFRLAGTPVSSTYKTDRHHITEILLKVALKTLALTLACFIVEYIEMIIENIACCVLLVEGYSSTQWSSRVSPAWWTPMTSVVPWKSMRLLCNAKLTCVQLFHGQNKLH